MSDEIPRPLCATEDCRQPLLLVRDGRTLCARCEQAGGGDPWRWIRTDPKD